FASASAFAELRVGRRRRRLAPCVRRAASDSARQIGHSGPNARGPAMPTSSPEREVYYADYLKLDQLLTAQQPESARRGRPAHDEMLFIIVHQAYELWFKQILNELDRIQADFGGDVVEDEYLGRIVHGLDRIVEILKLLIQQLEVLETMTPLDF